MIRQLAIATDLNGVIGANDKLLYKSQTDLANFARFTRGTVLIAGRKTAQEMIGMGVSFTQKRPIVVVTERDHVTFRNLSDAGNVYYASDLQDAILVAGNVAEQNGLLGWTIIGGKSIYDQFLQPSFGVELDMAYMASFRKAIIHPASPEAVRLAGGCPAKALDKLIPEGRHIESVMDVSLDWSSATEAKRCSVSFCYSYNTRAVDPREIAKKANGKVIQINAAAGLITLPLDEITGYTMRRLANQMDIHTANRTFEIRLESGSAGLNYLQHIIDQHLLYKGTTK